MSHLEHFPQASDGRGEGGSPLATGSAGFASTFHSNIRRVGPAKVVFLPENVIIHIHLGMSVSLNRRHAVFVNASCGQRSEWS
jgi:hypothetical protein